MRRFRTIILASLAATALALSGCGSGGGSSSSSGGTGGGGGGGGGTAGGAVSSALFEEAAMPGFGGSFTAGVAINDSAVPEVVGFSENDTAVVKAASWTIVGGVPSVAAELAPLAGNTYSAAYGINNGGIAVGESGATADVGGLPTADANTVAVYWPRGAVDPAPLSTAGLFAGRASAAYAINTAGQVVGEAAANADGDTVAVFWPGVGSSPVVLAGLPTSGSASSSAYSIAADGTIVGESRNAAGRMQAVAWLPTGPGAYGGPVPLAPLVNQRASVALGVDDAGHIVGEAELEDGTLRGMVWNDDGSVLADLGAATSAAAINADGWISGTAAASTGNDQAIVWNLADPADNQVISPAFSQAYDINDAGIVVGVSGTGASISVPR
jgi:uncharacterized membrane protein